MAGLILSRSARWTRRAAGVAGCDERREERKGKKGMERGERREVRIDGLPELGQRDDRGAENETCNKVSF